MLVATLLATRAAGQPVERPPCAACVVLVAAPGQSLLVSEPLNDIEVLVRTTAGVAPGDAAGVRQALAAIRAAGGRPGLLIAGTGGGPEITGIVELANRVVVDMRSERASADELAFQVKSRFTELRAAKPDVLLGILGHSDDVAALLQRDVASYVDFFARPLASSSALAMLAMPPPLAAIHPANTEPAAATPPTADRWLVELPGDAIAAARLLGDVARAAPLLREGLVAGGTVDVRCGDRRALTYLDPESLDTIAVARACRGDLAISPPQEASARVTLSSGDVLIRVRAAEGRFAEGVQVLGSRTLTVREIIARHQAAAARQRREVHHLISTGSMTLAFEAPGFSAPLAITTQAVIYTAPDRVEIEQRDIRVNGIAFPGGGVPRLPLLEPERVASPPLAISLTDVYAYTLAGEDEAGGVRCYVVAFAPIDRDRSLYAGKVWIAMDSFAMVRISAVQTRLRGPIVSSEQIDDFRPDTGNHWLLARSEVRQLYEGAGYRTPIHRVVAIDAHEINPPAFEARRQAAYASPSVMLRDTAEGFRYLTRETPKTKEGTPPAIVPSIAGPSQHVRTIAVGVIVDPNISRPLPFAGLSYLDFNLFDTGTQFNGFFGGTYGQLAVSVPSLAGTRWQLAGRAFAIASSYNDRAFVNGRERYEANISQRPAHASVWTLRPLTPRVTARAGYELDYTGFGRASSTSASFLVPASQVAHSIRLGMDGQWAGWFASVWWAGARRAGWRPWGDESAGPRVAVAEYDPRHDDYQRTGATLARSMVISPRLVGRLEAAWMAGRDLDRFSRYTFGSFDNRLRGYPSALIRYDRGGVLRGSAAWAAGRLLRLDGFLDTAFVHDPGFGDQIKNYTGIGAAAEVPAPFGTLVAIEWGYGFQGLSSDGRKGTQVVRITGYKIF